MKNIYSSGQANQLQKQRQKRSQRQRAALIAMSALVVLTVAFTIWALVYIMVRGNETPRLAFITKREVEETVKCSIVVIDQYSKILAPADGILVPFVEEGDRVARGDRIAMIVPSNLKEDVNSFFLSNKACNIKRILSAGLENTTVGALPKTRSDGLMREAILSLSRASTVGDLSSLQSAIRKMDRAFNEYRAEGLNSEGDDELIELLRERNRLLEQLEAFAVPGGILTASFPGTVSFYVSRSGEVKDEQEWREIADPRAEIERLADPSLQPLDSRGNHVTANMPVACISNVSASNMIAVIPHNSDMENQLKRGDTVDLIISPDLRLDRCFVSGVVRGEKDDSIFLTADAKTELPSRLTAMTDVLMTVNTMTGPAVPVRSLIDFHADTRMARIKKVEKGVTRTIPIRVLVYDGVHAVIENLEGVEPLKEAELYVVNPWTIGEGQLIE